MIEREGEYRRGEGWTDMDGGGRKEKTEVSEFQNLQY
jgi:hypothetical protein